ncbi:MAG: aspartate kinase [Lachnospiraceae bacterium]|nr:aspartate kinase [Lachnospiraceae bacterium]
MNVKVVKFGGSSLADAAQFKKACDIIRADQGRRFVVDSAPGKRAGDDAKVTDLLYQCHREAEEGGDFRETLQKVKARFTEIAEGLQLTSVDLNAEFAEIEKQLAAGICADYAASRGEYLNGKLLAAALGYEFVDAAEIIRFLPDGSFDADTTNVLAAMRLENTEHAVIPGFYGLTAVRDDDADAAKDPAFIKTFSRGGSDITGSIIARAVHADVYENWTDVSGFMVADPRVVENPARIETITYLELRELAYMGATVLHEDAIFPVRKEGIPINIRNTNAPEEEGTWIVESTAKKSRYTITGIAGKKDFCSINIEKDMMNSEVGFIRRVLQAFEDQNISVEHVPSGIDTMTVFVHQDEFIAKEQQVVSEIHRLAKPDLLEIESDLALIAVVGRGMKSMRGTAGRIFSALAHASVNVRMIDQGSSELNIIIGVEGRDFERAIRAIYDIFVTTAL